MPFREKLLRTNWVVLIFNCPNSKINFTNALFTRYVPMQETEVVKFTMDIQLRMTHSYKFYVYFKNNVRSICNVLELK